MTFLFVSFVRMVTLPMEILIILGLAHVNLALKENIEIPNKYNVNFVIAENTIIKKQLNLALKIHVDSF